MSKILSINVSIPLKALETKLANFIFPAPVTPLLKRLTVREMFESLVYAARTGKDIEFPSLNLIDMYEIEGAYQISFFSRALAAFQRDINQILLTYDIFDEVVSGAYGEAAIVKGCLLLSPIAPEQDLYIEKHDVPNHYRPKNISGAVPSGVLGVSVPCGADLF